MHKTTAFSGGFRYRPTTSTSFSSNRLSFDSLKVFTRCGASPRADQIRCTVAGLTPCALAMVRHDQCVSPGGLSRRVACTIAATFSALIDGLRPRPALTLPKFASPSAANRSRQAVTLAGEAPSRCGAARATASFSRISRWPSVRRRGAVAGRILHHTTINSYLRDTTLGTWCRGVTDEHQSGLRRALSRQNSLPSGSARTCHCSSPVWPMSAGRAPSFRRRSSSAS